MAAKGNYYMCKLNFYFPTIAVFTYICNSYPKSINISTLATCYTYKTPLTSTSSKFWTLASFCVILNNQTNIID